VRYIHFHDYLKDVLLIATFSGAVYVWCVTKEETPRHLVQVTKTVTSLRCAMGDVKVTSAKTMTVLYLLIGTGLGQMSLYSHHTDLTLLSSHDLTLEWSIIAHEPSDGPFNDQFGSLRKL